MKNSLRNLQDALNAALEDKSVSYNELVSTFRSTLYDNVDRHKAVSTKAQDVIDEVLSTSGADYSDPLRPFPYFTYAGAASADTISFNLGEDTISLGTDTISMGGDPISLGGDTIINPLEARKSIA